MTEQAPKPTVLAVHPGAELFGSDRMFLESVIGLRESGARVVAVLPDQGPLVPMLADAGAAVVIVPMLVLRKALLKPSGWGRLIRDGARGLVAAVRLVKRQRPAAIYVSTITIPQWPIVGRAMGVPVTTHVHEAEAGANPWVNRALYAPHLLAQRLIVNSEFSRRTMAQSFHSLGERAVVVLNGVYGPDDPSPPRQKVDQLRILFVGRLSPRKGPDVAVQALRQLTERGIEARLTLLGSVFTGYEWFEQELHEQVAAAGLSDRVNFLGFAPDVWPVIADADVVVVPSTAGEPFGNTAVEAVLAQRPVIASDIGGLPEAASGYATTRLTPPGDAQALADRLQELRIEWSRVLDDVAASSAAAVERHAPSAYRADVATAVLGVATEGSCDSHTQL